MKKILLLSAILMVIFASVAQQPTKRELKSMRKSIGVSPNFVYIQAGNLLLDSVQYQYESFWMLKSEVSNEMYYQFLNALQLEGKTNEYEIAKVSKEPWSNQKNDNRHVKYDTSLSYKIYPVVNISYEGAVLFCKWLNSTLIDTSWEYRLPTRAEWIFAAKVDDFGYYSMGGPFIRHINGAPLYRYEILGDEYIYEDENGDAKVFQNKEYRNRILSFPIHVLSILPNTKGLYNMCGNVAEMVVEQGVAVGGSFENTGYDIRIESTQSFSKPSHLVGFRPVLVRKK